MEYPEMIPERDPANVARKVEPSAKENMAAATVGGKATVRQLRQLGERGIERAKLFLSVLRLRRK